MRFEGPEQFEVERPSPPGTTALATGIGRTPTTADSRRIRSACASWLNVARSEFRKTWLPGRGQPQRAGYRGSLACCTSIDRVLSRPELAGCAAHLGLRGDGAHGAARRREAADPPADDAPPEAAENRPHAPLLPQRCLVPRLARHRPHPTWTARAQRHQVRDGGQPAQLPTRVPPTRPLARRLCRRRSRPPREPGRGIHGYTAAPANTPVRSRPHAGAASQQRVTVPLDGEGDAHRNRVSSRG